MARLRIEVAYALAGRQEIVELRLATGTTAGQAAEASGLSAVGLVLGIGGKTVPANRVLREGDRVDLLRPLAAEPKDARRRRAQKARRR